MTGARRRIGVLGGTFDPIHVGHLALARSARAALALDEVWFIPTGRSWQKDASRASAAQRLEMTRLAVDGLPADEGYRVDDREVRRDGPTYTVETLHALRGEVGDAALVLVMGSDQFRNLPSWHRWTELLAHAHIATTRRERIGLEDLPAPLESIVSRCGRDALPDAPAGSIVFFTMPPVAVSATALRAQLGRGERPVELLPPAVLDYIGSQSLYLRG